MFSSTTLRCLPVIHSYLWPCSLIGQPGFETNTRTVRVTYMVRVPLTTASPQGTAGRHLQGERLRTPKKVQSTGFCLARQLSTVKAGATYRDIMDSVTGNVTAIYPAQHPQLEGAEADQYVFGDASSLAQTYVVASPLEGLRVSLEVGQVQGATVGSTFEVYRPGTKKLAPPEKPVAKVELTKVQAFSSKGKMDCAVVPGG